MTRLKKAVKEIAGSLGYDVIRKNGGGEAELTRGVVARFRAHGQDVSFFVADEWDYIQAHHLKGHFYEEEELALIGRHLTGGVLADIGANIGNHAIYALKFLGVERVIAFEPNPKAARLLHVNLALNGLTGSVEHRGVGLGDRCTTASLVAPAHKDLGSTRLAVGEAARGAPGLACQVLTGDEALAGEPRIDMIKIDTEGMELQVLAGLEATLARHRPMLFVEVDDANHAAFLEMMTSRGYEMADTFRRYATNCNYLLAPRR